MIASRWTFATIDAAATEHTNESPFGYALCGIGSPGISRPSTTTNPGATGSGSTARRSPVHDGASSDGAPLLPSPGVAYQRAGYGVKSERSSATAPSGVTTADGGVRRLLQERRVLPRQEPPRPCRDETAERGLAAV